MRELAAALGLLAAALYAGDARCAGNVTTQARAVGAFTKLDLRAPIRADVHEGRAARVTVAIDDALQSELVTRVSGDTLIVELDTHRNNVEISDGARVTIEVPSLAAIEIEGPGDAWVDGAGPHPRVDFRLEGPGNLHWTGEADVVRCRIDGPGDAVLRGKAKRLDAIANGPGDVDGRAFAIDGGTFDVEGPGHVTADLHGGDVSVVVNGPGGFRYTGDARFTRREVNGPGHIRKL